MSDLAAGKTKEGAGYIVRTSRNALWGPFKTAEDAIRFGHDALKAGRWVVVPLLDPTLEDEEKPDPFPLAGRRWDRTAEQVVAVGEFWQGRKTLHEAMAMFTSGIESVPAGDGGDRPA